MPPKNRLGLRKCTEKGGKEVSARPSLNRVAVENFTAFFRKIVNII